MRAALSTLAALLMLLLASHGLGRAGLEAGSARAPAVEVLVFEHPDCVYCRVFRRDVLPRYHDAIGASAAPLRFVDIATSDTDSLGLKARLDTLPTAVVMREGREVDRIVGYWGPSNFFKLLSYILMRIE
jgi:hypothetical protein